MAEANDGGQLELPNLPQVTGELMAVVATVAHNAWAVAYNLSADYQRAGDAEGAAELKSAAEAMEALWKQSAAIFERAQREGAQVDDVAATQMVLTLCAQLGIATGFRKIAQTLLE